MICVVERDLPRPIAYMSSLLLLAGVVAMVWAAMRPVESEPEEVPVSNVKVVIDAGHGGEDGGTVKYGLLEKDITLDLALRMERALAARGLASVMTRRADVKISLSDRVAIAKQHPGAIFVSIHANRFASERVRGAEVYVTTPTEPVVLRLEPADKGRPYRDGRSAELGRRILEKIAAAVEMPIRDVREARFVVTREVPAPAVLLECGYLSNPADAYLLSRAENRQKMAEAVAQACAEYLADVIVNRLLGCTAWTPEDAQSPVSLDSPDEAP